MSSAINPDAEEDLDLDGIDLSPNPGYGGGQNLDRRRTEMTVQNHFGGGKLESEVKRPSLSNKEEAQYMPLSCMNTFTQDWVIKVKVNKKVFKTYNNAKGPGQLLNVDLMDKQGVAIQGTFFGEGATKMDQHIAQGCVYVMSGG